MTGFYVKFHFKVSKYPSLEGRFPQGKYITVRVRSSSGKLH